MPRSVSHWSPYAAGTTARRWRRCCRQPPCRAGRSARALQARDFPFHYLCGERDAKFRAIAQTLAADLHLIHHAGHNAHRDNPAAVIACLAQILAS
jgi:pimeloyl-ACP methyl ester carboxylesterase